MDTSRWLPVCGRPARDTSPCFRTWLQSFQPTFSATLRISDSWSPTRIQKLPRTLPWPLRDSAQVPTYSFKSRLWPPYSLVSGKNADPPTPNGSVRCISDLCRLATVTQSDPLAFGGPTDPTTAPCAERHHAQGPFLNLPCQRLSYLWSKESSCLIKDTAFPYGRPQWWPCPPHPLSPVPDADGALSRSSLRLYDHHPSFLTDTPVLKPTAKSVAPSCSSWCGYPAGPFIPSSCDLGLQSPVLPSVINVVPAALMPTVASCAWSLPSLPPTILFTTTSPPKPAAPIKF